MSFKKKISLFFLLPLCIKSAFVFTQITPHEAVIQMQQGINLGNTLEPPDEGGWNNPVAQEYYFDLYKQAGFKCVRVPVRWDEHTQYVSPYKIDESWLQRVEQVVDWGLERNLFVVLNAHHEEWIKSNYANAYYRARFDSIWSQISTRFRDKSYRLIFEIINEPYGLTKAQNDELHQRILSIIRQTNPLRIVIIQGHNWGGSDELIQAAVPDDTLIMGSFHSYDPYTFGLLGEGTWGVPADISALNNKFISVKNWSDANNIPVFLGEFGSLRSCDYNSRMKHYETYVELAQKYGFAWCAWDDGGDFRILDRQNRKWDEVKDILIHSSDIAPSNPRLDIFQDTIIRVAWTNRAGDYDSILIERRTSTGDYSKIASLNGDTAFFFDLNAVQSAYNYYRVIAHYNSADDVFSQPVRILMPVYEPETRESFLGSPAILPGAVEAENFDKGGEGLSYHDMDNSNLAGAYRPLEAVDIYDRPGGGYHIGNALPGEWYEYSVEIMEEGNYLVNFYLAAIQGGGEFKINLGEVESDTLMAPNTGSWLTTKNVSSVMKLFKGEQIMRFTVISEPLFNIDKFDFQLTTLNQDDDSFNKTTAFTAFQNANNDLVLKLPDNRLINRLQLFDVNGLLVFSKINPACDLIISTFNMPQGVYFIQAFEDNRFLSDRIIIH